MLLPVEVVNRWRPGCRSLDKEPGHIITIIIGIMRLYIAALSYIPVVARRLST